MQEPPVRIGMMLYTLIEPHPGSHRAYNRWYERDHFYSGVLTLPGTLAGQRWVATPALKARRLPAASSVVPDAQRGSFLTTYFVDEERTDEWDAAASDAVHALAAAGRLWPERDHVLTRFFDYGFAVYRDDDPVPAVQTLDHRYPGLVTMVGRGAEGTTLTRVFAALRDDFLPAALVGSPIASVLTFSGHPFAGDRPPDLPVDPDPESRFLQLWFVDHAPDVVWADTFVPLAQRFAADETLELEWMAGFVPTLPGTDSHVDLLEAAETGNAQQLVHPRAVVADYFRRVTDADPRLADLFHEDARLVGLGTVTQGRGAIAAFYAEATERGAPSPHLVAPLLVDGGRVGAEIAIDLADGSQIHVMDLFEIDDGRIRSLTYFVADH